jgi:uncharacterized phage protein gp47/JayE
MTTYGLTPEGFTRKRLPDILDELKAAYRGAFGDDVLVDGESVFGELIGIKAEPLAKLWELAESVYLSAYPDSAEGVPLDNAVAITGHARLAARYSTATVTCATTGATPVTLPVGRQVKVPGTGATFETLAKAIIPAGGSIDVDVRGIDTGPLEAPSGTMTGIVTPVSGWTSVTNAADAIVGRDIETDAALRIRRADELATAQGGTIAAMEARIPALVDGVTFCAVDENRTDTTNGDGLPPHSVHVVVIGGSDADVAAAIWRTKPVGANTHGDESAVIVDSGGNSQTIYWDRATVVRMYLIVNATVDGTFPSDGDDRITALLAAYDGDLSNGDDVINWRLMAQLDGIPGITDLEILQGKSTPPTLSSNTAIAANERASIAAADITVNTSP